jgi:hypothetical protein
VTEDDKPPRKKGSRTPPSGVRTPPSSVRPASEPEERTAAPDTSASLDTAPTAGAKQPGTQTVEVAPQAYEALPPNDPPSGDMRPLDRELQPPDTRTFETAANHLADTRTSAKRPPDVRTPDTRISDTRASDARRPDTRASDARTPDARTATRTADTSTSVDLAQSPEYVPAPIPYDAPTQPTGPTGSTGPTGPAGPHDDAASDEAILLPTSYDEAALRDAVGAPLPRPKRKKRDRDDDDGPRGPRRTVAIAALAIIAGLGIAAFVFLGRANSQRYAITCSTTQVTAERGRGFPPWGTKPMTGPEWRPVALPANAECKPRETEDPAELESWYLDLLLDRASTTLTAKNLLDSVQAGKPNPLDLAADQLNQALLLSRSPAHRDQRKEVERLLGDVQYWRASLRLRDAAAALSDAARQFDVAATQRPRHVTDAAAWASFLRTLVDQLHAGPGGVPAAPGVVAPVPGPSEQPMAPMGTALPVEPDGSASEPATPPDAGLPTGGVLL